METSSYLPIEEFEQNINPNETLSSVWLVGPSSEGAKYTIGFSSSKPPQIVIYSERKKNEKRAGFIKGSSDAYKIVNKLQKELGGKIESSEYGTAFNNDIHTIIDPEMKITSKKITEVARCIIKELGSKEKDFKIKPIL
jgi:hypothetical protein